MAVRTIAFVCAIGAGLLASLGAVLPGDPALAAERTGVLPKAGATDSLPVATDVLLLVPKP